MNNLIAFIQRFHYWLLFIFLEAVSIVLLFRFNHYQGSVWFSSSNAVAGKLLEWRSDVGAFFDLTDVNRQLTLRNTELEAELADANARIRQLTTDTLSAAHRDTLSSYRLIEAKVVSQTINKSSNLITIDRGIYDGVERDMAVVSGRGIVGIVYIASSHYSVVIPVINAQSNISCSIRGRGYFGFLHWDGGDVSTAYIDEIPRHAQLEKGDIVETSGYSAIFPPGLAIGKVQEVQNNADGTSYRVKTSLYTDFSTLRDVCVIDNARMREQAEILRAAQDSISIKENQ